jgi:hypothetical protein
MKPEFRSLYQVKRILLSGIPGSKVESRILAGAKCFFFCVAFSAAVEKLLLYVHGCGYDGSRMRHGMSVFAGRINIDLARKPGHRFPPISAKNAEMDGAPRQCLVA